MLVQKRQKVLWEKHCRLGREKVICPYVIHSASAVDPQ
jgi:hypothetical protein